MSKATTLTSLWRLLLAFCLLGVSSADAAINKRVALVIANAEYLHTKTLKNPANDAELIVGKLQGLGFQVQIEKNLDARGFSRAIQTFSSTLSKDTDALFYYAGHGLQFNGENYLVGIDAKLENEATLQFETFRLNTVISLMEAKAGTTLIFWDGCRNNPLADGLLLLGRSVSISESSPAVRGAAPIPPRRGDTLVVFSAEPGKFALDGQGNFSPFAEALANHIGTPDLEIETMLKRVTADVQETTKSYQSPQRLSQLTKEFYFYRQENARAAYEEELETLRAKVAQLEQPAPEKHFAILSSDQTIAQQTSPLTRSAATAPSPNVPVISAGAQDVPPVPASEPNGAPSDVVVTVNMGQSTIIRRLRISPDGKLLAIGGDDGIIRIVNLDTFEVIRAINAHVGRISDLDFAPDSRTLLSAGRDGFVRFWDAQTGQRAKEELRVENTVPYSARLNPSFPNRFVLMGDKEGRLIVWDLIRNRRVVLNERFHNGPVLSVAYQPRGKGTYLSAGGDGLLKVRLPEGQRYTVHAHNGAIFAAGYNSRGTLIYSAGTDRKIKIWDPNKLDREYPEAVFEGHLKYIIAATISPDDRVLASGGGDKAINLWDLASRKLIARLVGHTSDIEALAVTPNSRFIISASEDKSVRIWSIDDRKELVRMFFKSESEKFAGVTYDNKSFGDRDSDVMSIFVDGRAVGDKEAARSVKYIGHGIAIIDSGRMPH